MTKPFALALKKRAEEVAEILSQHREFNPTNEVFTLGEIIPLSESTACVIYDKNTGKKVALFFYYLIANDGKWMNFVPTDSHILGMESFGKIKARVEAENFEKNWEAHEQSA